MIQRTSRPVATIVALILILAGANGACAHGIGAEATMTDGKVQIQAYFDDDTPARDAKVHVTDDDGKTIAEGKTDEKGHWTFEAPPAGKYHLVVDAGAGHRRKLAVTIPSDAAEAKQVSEGDSRDAFTRIPWSRIAIGLAAIFAASIALPWLLKRIRRQQT